MGTFESLRTSWTWRLAERVKEHAAELKPDSKDLHVAKKSAMRWMIESQLADTKSNNFSAIAREWTAFADNTIEIALAKAWRHPRIAKRCINLEKNCSKTSSVIPGLFVLGLGKLGGHDLNFSSDVDLVAFFTPKSLPVTNHEERMDVAVRVLREVNTILMPPSSRQQIWRIDWRLRPDPSVTNLAMSSDAGANYFLFRAAPWRRLAMIKARVVAGDKKAGEAFLAQIAHYLWRATLDFRAKDDVCAMKNKIRADHPELEPQRQRLVPLDTAGGFHVKLGLGGIREIEFMVNALQMVWGGRLPQLRTTITLEALEALRETQLIAPDEAQALRAAYIFLRRAENAIQMLDDRHEHSLPESRTSQELVAALVGLDWQSFHEQLAEHRAKVHAPFENFFKASEPLKRAANPDIIIEEIRQNRYDAKSLLEEWQASFKRYGLPESSRDALPALAKRCESLVAYALAPEQTAKALEDFFRRLPPGGQYLRLLAEVPHLADNVLLPYARGGEFKTLLIQSPHVTDLLVEQHGKTLTNRIIMRQEALHLRSVPDYESQLIGLRRWVNEQLYLIYLSVDKGEHNPQEAETLLCDLAEEALAQTQHVVCNYLGLKDSPLTILALGKLGMEALPPRSDLDLIFLCNSTDDLKLANKFSSRLRTALHTNMKEGKVWEIDTRLRPSGKAGPPTISMERFKNHHLTQAHNWEHLALVPARALSGVLSSKVNSFCADILAKPRDLLQARADCTRMLTRLRKHRIESIPNDHLSAKLRHGGLMELEYGLACAAILKQPLNVQESLRFWRDLLFYIRLYGLLRQPINQIKADVKKRLDHFFGPDIPEQVRYHSAVVHQALANLNIDQKYTEEADKPVLWT